MGFLKIDGTLDTNALPNKKAGTSFGIGPSKRIILLAWIFLHHNNNWKCFDLSTRKTFHGFLTTISFNISYGLLYGSSLWKQNSAYKR